MNLLEACGLSTEGMTPSETAGRARVVLEAADRLMARWAAGEGED